MRKLVLVITFIIYNIFSVNAEDLKLDFLNSEKKTFLWMSCKISDYKVLNEIRLWKLQSKEFFLDWNNDILYRDSIDNFEQRYINFTTLENKLNKYWDTPYKTLITKNWKFNISLINNSGIVFYWIINNSSYWTDNEELLFELSTDKNELIFSTDKYIYRERNWIIFKEGLDLLNMWEEVKNITYSNLTNIKKIIYKEDKIFILWLNKIWNFKKIECKINTSNFILWWKYKINTWKKEELELKIDFLEKDNNILKYSEELKKIVKWMDMKKRIKLLYKIRELKNNLKIYNQHKNILDYLDYLISLSMYSNIK